MISKVGRNSLNGLKEQVPTEHHESGQPNIFLRKRDLRGQSSDEFATFLF